MTPAVQLCFNLFSMVMIHYGMEQVVDQIMTAVTWNNPPWLRKQLPSTTTDNNIKMRLCREDAPDEDTSVEINHWNLCSVNRIPNFVHAAFTEFKIAEIV